MTQITLQSRPFGTFTTGPEPSEADVFTPDDPGPIQNEGPGPATKRFTRILKEVNHDILHEFGPEIEYDRVTPDDLDYCFTQVTMYHRTVQAVAFELNLRPHTLQQAWKKYALKNDLWQDNHGHWFQNDQAIPLMSYDPRRPKFDLEEARSLFDECDRV